MEDKNKNFMEFIEQEKTFNYLLYGFGGTVAIILIYITGGIILESLSKAGIILVTNGILNSVGQLVFMLVPTMLFLRYMPDKTSNVLMINYKRKPSVYIVSILGFFPLLVFYTNYAYFQDIYISVYFQPYYDNFKNFIEKVYKDIIFSNGNYAFISAVVCTAVVPAVCEEILFRGFLFSNLIKRLKPVTVILITSLVFTLVHFNPVGFVPLFLIGAYLGFTAYYAKSITIPIILHFLNNFISVTALYSPELEKLDKDPSGIPLEYLVLSMVGASVLLVFTARFLVNNTGSIESREEKPLMNFV